MPAAVVPAPVRPLGEGRRVRWGILGWAGIAARRVVPALRQSHRNEVVAVASRDLQRARSAAQAEGIPHSYGSYAELLADAAVDAVYIPLPNTLHEEWTIRAAEAGKHVLCEKPLATTASAARAMVQACRVHGVRLMEGLMYRFHPQHARVRALLAAGTIGEPKLMRAAFCIRMDRPPGDIRFSPELGGGALLDLGVYTIDSVRFLLEDEPSPVSAQLQVDRRRIDTAAVAVLGMRRGVLAEVAASFEASDGGTYEILGTSGSVRVYQAYSQRSGGATIVTWEDGSDAHEERFPLVDQYLLQFDAFARALQEGGPPPIPDDAGVGNLVVIDAIRASAATGRTIDLDGAEGQSSAGADAAT